jgi:predicted protein tyrosine phosphatase
MIYGTVIEAHIMNKITDQIYVGSYAAAEMLSYRNSEGITHILNCTPDAHEDLTDFDVRQINIHDGFAIPPDSIRFAIESIAEAVHSGGKILVHCHAGVSRSVSLICAYLMYSGFSWDEALQFVRERRPQAFPHPMIARSIKHYFGRIISPKTTLLK